MRERSGPGNGTDGDDCMPASHPASAHPRGGSCDWWTPGRFALILGLCLLALYPDVVLGGRTFFHRDFGNYSYPLAAWTRDAIRGGELPLWNPLSYCGLPFLAQWNTMVLYPGNFFLWIFPLQWSLGVFCLLHAWLGGLGMYRLGARWTGSRTAGACAGFAFAFSGLVQQGLMWPSVSATLGWMPWVVAAVESAARRGGRRRMAAAAAIGAVQMLAGTPEFILATWAIATLVVGARVRATAAIRAGLRIVSIAVVVTALAAAQLLPFFELLGLSQRDAGAATLDWSLHASRLINFLVPSHALIRGVDGVYFDQHQGWLASFSVGILTLVFGVALLGFRGRAGPRRAVRPLLWVLAATAILGVLLALGPRGGVLLAVQWMIPGLGLMQFSVKFLVLTTFCLPLLAAFGVRLTLVSLRAPAPGGLRPVWIPGLLAVGGVASVGAQAAGAAFAAITPNLTPQLLNVGGRLLVLCCGFGLLMRSAQSVKSSGSPNGAVLWIAAIFALDGWTSMPRNHPSVPMAAYAGHLLAPSKSAPGETTTSPAAASSGGVVPTWNGRALMSKDAYDVLMRFRLADPMNACVLKRLALWANWNLLDGAAKVDGFFPLTLAPMDEVHTRLFRSAQPRPEALKDLLGVTRETSPTNPFEWVSRSGALPLFSGGQQVKFGGDETQFSAITAADFQPREILWLDESKRPLYVDVAAGKVTVTGVEVTSRRLACEIDCPQPAVLLITQAYHPAWRASVGGVQVPVHRANFAFQAVRVAAGRQRVELRYEDRTFVVGAGISLVTWMGLLVSACLRQGRAGA